MTPPATPDLADLTAFAAVARARGFREAARAGPGNASSLSEAVRRLEARLGVRLLHRTTRSVSPTEAGRRLLERLEPLLGEVTAALDVVNGFREKPMGTLKLNVPVSAARLVLPGLVPAFLAAFPDIRLEVTSDDSFVDILAAGCDAGIRYDERLEQDMIAIPIGPRVQRMATGAAPAYLARREAPAHPRELLDHDCIRFRLNSGAGGTWEFERAGEIVRLEPDGPLLVGGGSVVELGLAAAVGGTGVVHTFEDWLRPHFATGELVPLLEPWWQAFSGPFLYYPGRRLVPAPLRAFVDFVKARNRQVDAAVAATPGRKPGAAAKS